MIDHNKIGNCESDDASWEVTHWKSDDEDKMMLHYHDINDESKLPFHFVMSHQEFDDLVNLINRMQKEYPKEK